MKVFRQTLLNKITVLIKNYRFTHGKRDTLFCRICGVDYSDYKLSKKRILTLMVRSKDVYICPTCFLQLSLEENMIISDLELSQLFWVYRNLNRLADKMEDIELHNILHGLASDILEVLD